MTGLAKVESSGLAVADSGPDLPAIFTLAAKLVKANGFLPSHLVNDGQIAAVILAGAELGIPPMAAIRGIKLVKGNVTLDASLQLGVMTRCGVKFKWLEQTDKVARIRLERPGFDAHEQSFTIEEAQRAGLVKDGSNWKTYPAAMLRARCVSAAGKAYCPDMLSGVYAPDELEHLEEPKAQRARRTLDDVASATGPLASASASSSPSTGTPTTTTTVEYDGETGEVIPSLDDHLVALANTDAAQLGDWYATLTKINATEVQKKAAWKIFRTRCADFEIDANDFVKKDIQS